METILHREALQLLTLTFDAILRKQFNFVKNSNLPILYGGAGIQIAVYARRYVVDRSSYLHLPIFLLSHKSEVT